MQGHSCVVFEVLFPMHVTEVIKKAIQAVTLLEYLPPKLFYVVDFSICWLLVPLLYYKQLYIWQKPRFHLQADSFVALPECVYVRARACLSQ